jgi:hypothetical protein
LNGPVAPVQVTEGSASRRAARSLASSPESLTFFSAWAAMYMASYDWAANWSGAPLNFAL